jgi:hypothetical protein
MEVVCIHKPLSLMPPEMMAAGLELGKKIQAKPEEMIPGGKVKGSYYARALWAIYCVWEVPSVESLMPVAEQLKMVGWNTEIIPVDEAEVALQKLEKAMRR